MIPNQESNNNNQPELQPTKSNIPFMGQLLNPSNYNDINDIPSEDETFQSFLATICCPTFSFLSASFILSLIQIVIYIVMICYGIEHSIDQLFAPTLKTLDSFGMKNVISTHKGHVWRWVTAAFLHSNFIHLTINLISQIITGSYIEAMIGQWKTVLLFIYAAIAGEVFSCLINDDGVTAASNILYGMLGVYLAYTVINYFALDKEIGVTNKFCNLMFFIIIIALNITLGFNGDRVDFVGNFGAMLFCCFFGFFIIVPIEKNQGLFFSDRIWFWIGVGVSSIIIPLMIILFFTVRKI